jgi:GntR family transcriptional regulator
VSGFLTVDHRHATPIYAQLAQAIRAAVATGRLAPGEQLPTVRQLAVDLKVNSNTVARVYLDLERAGLLETRRGVGTFVSAEPPRAPKKSQRDPELRALARRSMDEAAALGFTADDLVRQIEQLTDQQGG